MVYRPIWIRICKRRAENTHQLYAGADAQDAGQYVQDAETNRCKKKQLRVICKSFRKNKRN